MASLFRFDPSRSEHPVPARKQRQLIEHALAHPLSPLDAGLREAFHQYQFKHYRRLLLVVNVLAQLAYLSYGFADAVVLEDLGWTSLQVRVLVLGTMLPVVLALFRWCPDVRVLDLALPVQILVAAVVWYELLSRSADPSIPHYLYASLIFIVLGNLCVQVAFLPSLVVSLAISVVTLYAAWQFNQGDGNGMLVFTLVYLPVLFFSLFMSLSTTLDRRRAFLRAVLQELTQEALSEANQRLHNLAHTDPLTGLGNRRHFEELSLRELAQAARYGQPLCVLMVDADHFKRVNDTHGHDVGDEVLRRLAATLRQELREGDVLARFGGEEFAVLLPNTALAEAQQVAERLRTAVVRQRLDLTNGAHVRFTISIGIAPCEGRAGDLNALLKAADTALYRAKAEGRDCVRIASPSALPEPATASVAVN